MKNARFKILALLLALALALSLLAGCSGEGEKPDSGSGAPFGSAGGNDSNDTKPNDGGTSGNTGSGQDTPEAELPALGREYAGEANPALAIAEKAAELLDGLPEGARPAWDNVAVTDNDTGEAEFHYAAARYTKEGSNALDLNVIWSVEDGCVREISMNVRDPEEVDIEALRAAVLSDDLMEGMGAFREKLYAREAWKSIGETVAHSADGYVAVESGFTGLYQLSLRNEGANLQKDGHFIYSADGGEAAVYGLVEDDGLPETLIIPEALGGCPVKTVSFTFLVAECGSSRQVIAIPNTAETVVIDQYIRAIFILPESVKTLSFPTVIPIQNAAPTIMCTGRETKLEAGMFIEGMTSYDGQVPTVQAFFGSELAEYAREHDWNLSYLDAVEGDRDAAKAYLSTLLADRLAKLAADSPEAAAELAEHASFDELLDLVMENWDDAMEDEDPQGPEAAEQLEKLKAGDYSVLENAWQSSSD